MSALDPSGPSQPNLDQVYSTADNPVSKEPAEQRQADTTSARDAPIADQRIPTKQTTSIDEATPSSQGYGTRGAGPSEKADTLTDQEAGRSQGDVDAEQMAAPGEGAVRDAVKNPSGGGGAEPGLETDLDRKKAQQAPMRESIQQEKQEELDVGGILGQRGGPANPVT